MRVTGKVKKGVVVLPPGSSLKEGQEVEIQPVPAAAADPFCLHESGPALATALDLPDDLAANHDYYLHGHARKQQPRRGRWIADTHPMPEMTAQQAAVDTDQLLAFAAETEGLPPDLAANHDHYLHGLPKK